MEIGGGELNANALTAVILLARRFEEAELLVERLRVPRQMVAELGREVVRQAAQEILVRFVDQPVLVAQGIRIGRAHADVLVGVDDAPDDPFDVAEWQRQPTVEVLNRGHARGDHFERRVERVEVGIGPAARDAGGEPELQRVVARADLDRRQPDVVVAVDQPRDDHVVGRTDDLVGTVLRCERVVTADVDDYAVALKYRTVLDDRRLVPAGDAEDDVFSTYQRR